MALRFSAPGKGIWQGVSPSSSIYPSDAAPSLINVRRSGGLWLTRRGQTPWRIIPGFGTTELIYSLYHRSERIRLAARGDNNEVALLDWLEGTDSSYQPVLDSDGNPVTDLASNRIHAITLTARELTYLVDGLTRMRRYDAATRLCDPVINIAAPTVAPRVFQTQYGFFERWSGAAPFGWTESDPVNFTLTLPPNPAVAPDFDLGDATVSLNSTPDTKGDWVSPRDTGDPPLGFECPSSSLAFWFQQTTRRGLRSVRVGTGKPAEWKGLIDPPLAGVPYVYFIPVAGRNVINYFSFNNVRPNPEIRRTYLSGIILPGRLLGRYQYRYTYYRPSTGQESSPSPAGPNEPIEVIEGASYQNTTASGMTRTAVIVHTRNPDWQAGDKIRIYRNGGVPSLTVEADGSPVWTFLAEIADFETLSDGATMAGDETMDVDDATAFEPDTSGQETYYQWALIDVGEDEEEYARVLSVAADTLTFADPLDFAHPDNAVVQLGYNDNVPNEVLATELRTIDLDRDSPPVGPKWVAETGDGRLWLANFLEDRDSDTTFEYRRALGIAVSNKPTPERPNDQEIFPEFTDPYTGDSLVQGFRFDLPSTPSGDEIMWFGIFQGLPTVLTRQALYRVTSFSQADWSASSVRKILDRGCIAGDAVVQLNGTLIWPSDGPSILQWDGRSAPRDISHLRIAGEPDDQLPTYLGDAPPGYEADETVLTTNGLTAYWEQWFAVAHAVGSSIYYRLWMIPDDPLIARISDLVLLSTTTVSSAEYGFTEDDLGRGLQVTNDNLGWFDGLYKITAVSDAGVATVDRAIGVFGGGYPYEEGTAALWDPFCSLRLDYSLAEDVWEPVRYWIDRDDDGIGDQAMGFDCAEVQYGAGDKRGLFAAAWNPAEGDVWEQETGSLDGDVPIKVVFSTPRAPLADGDVADFEGLLLRLHRSMGSNDVAHVTLTEGGSEYPESSLCTSIRLAPSQGGGDVEIPVPFNLDALPRGRWVQLSVVGDFRERPALREFTSAVLPIRQGRMSP